MPFILNIFDFKRKETTPNGLTMEVHSILNEEKANAFIELQNLSAEEITQEINLLSKGGLINDSPLRAKYFQIVLIYDNEKLVGYGYSYKEEEKETIYIDTIYVIQDYRKLRLSYLIIEILIEKSIEVFSSVQKIKAVTQPENNVAICLLKNLGFNYIK